MSQHDALNAVGNQDAKRALAVRVLDDEIEESEVRLEERRLAFLATQHPVAGDLRAIVSIMKINDDLERIGELSVNIIDRLPEQSSNIVDVFDFNHMGNLAADMIQKSIDAFVLKDHLLADKVCVLGDEVDAIQSAVFKRVTKLMKEPAADAEQLILFLTLSRNIERMADHATSIAQEVIYLVTGEIERHTGSSHEKLIQSLMD